MIASWLADRSAETACAAEARLLCDLGASASAAPGLPFPHPAARWGASGAMALTGRPGEPPRLAPGPLASAVDGALLAFQRLAGTTPSPTLTSRLLGARAASFGFARAGAETPGGSGRLLRCQDGWMALNLARQSDRELLPAWLEAEVPSEAPWPTLSALCRERARDPLVARARLLGLAAAPAVAAGAAPPWAQIETLAPPLDPANRRRPARVVDLSALWAGPLCGHLLSLAGAQVLKCESLSRPDGARTGARAFFDALNSRKRSVAIDLTRDEGLAQLKQLVAWADIVIESARPRALRQVGIEAERVVAEQAGKTWLSITGYGRGDPEAQWIAFGDDAGVAAGLAHAMADEKGPIFCADAIADPLTGTHAAFAALASWQAGGGHLVSLALRDVAAYAHALDVGCDPVAGVSLECDATGTGTGTGPHFVRLPDGARQTVLAPQPAYSGLRAAGLGQHNREVFAQLRSTARC